MFGATYKNTIRHSWQTTLIWGTGLAAMMIFMVMLTPTMNAIDFVSMFEDLPPAVLGAVGIGEDIQIMATQEGLLAMGFFGKFMLIFAAYPVVMGLRITANDEDDGILDMVLSLPVPRWQVVLERFLAYTTNIIVVIAMVIAGLYIGVAGVNLDEPLDTQKLVIASLNLIPIMTFVLAATAFVATLIDQKQKVITIMTVFVIASFILQTVGAMVSASWMDPIEALSFFTYYNPERILKEGIVPWHVAVMVLLSIGLIGISLPTFQRRDISS